MASDELRLAKLRALVRSQWGVEITGELVGENAAGIVDGYGYFYAEDPNTTICSIVVWALRQKCVGVRILSEQPAAFAARVATYFALPVSVWHFSQGAMVEQVPEPLPVLVPSPEEIENLVALITAVGLDVVEEHGVVTGELNGLELCRIIDGDPPTLAVGIGRFDREATALMYPDTAPQDALARAVEMVAPQRQNLKSVHPLAQLARERLYRTLLCARPELVGASDLQPVATSVPRKNLKESTPAALFGVCTDGQPILVIVAARPDLEAVGIATDTRAWQYPGVKTVLAVPVADAFPALAEACAALREPIEMVAVDYVNA